MSEPVAAATEDAAPSVPASTSPAPAPSRAAGALAAFRSRRASVAGAPAAAALAAAETIPAATPAAPSVAPAIPADIADAAKRWASHLKAESARIAAQAESLGEDDRALLEGITDVGLRAKVLERLRSSSDAAPAKARAAPRAAGGPPSASSVDFASAIKDPRAMAEAKAKDPAGFAAFFSSALKSAGRKSTLDGASKRN
jgi:hypothetical protein